MVRVFYALGLLWTIQEMGTWPALRDVATVEPQWPARWIDETAPAGGITAILLLLGVGSVLSALWPTSRSWRALYAFGLLQYMAVKYGFGKVNHDFHAWLWVAGLFVLLPSGRPDGRADSGRRQRGLAVVWSAQVVVLFFYTLTGLWKLVYAVEALVSDKISTFEPQGFALIIGERLLATDQQTVLGEFLVRNEVPGWLLFNGTVYLEAAALLIALRPRLHRLWGGGLIAFHIGTQLAMGFTFTRNVALLALLFMASPFAPERAPVREILLDLPGVHFVSRRWRALRDR
jgi:hypothetical protein